MCRQGSTPAELNTRHLARECDQRNFALGFAPALLSVYVLRVVDTFRFEEWAKTADYSKPYIVSTCPPVKSMEAEAPRRLQLIVLKAGATGRSEYAAKGKTGTQLPQSELVRKTLLEYGPPRANFAYDGLQDVHIFAPRPGIAHSDQASKSCCVFSDVEESSWHNT